MKSLFLSAALLLACVTAVPAAPLPETPDRWEYCEIDFKFVPAVRHRSVPMIPAPAPGAPAAPAAPAAAPVPGLAPPPVESVHLITGKEEVEAPNWEGLANSLKAAESKGTEVAQRLRVFNKLGSEGWEMVEYHRDTLTSTDSWVFRRKVSK